MRIQPTPTESILNQINKGYGGTAQTPERKTHLLQCSTLLLENNRRGS